MESRQSNKELVKQRGGNEKGSSFVISDVFSSFFLSPHQSKEFQVKAPLCSRSPFALPSSSFFLSANPPLGCQISLPTSTRLSVTLRDFPPCSLSPFQALLHLHWIVFRKQCDLFQGANLSVPNVMPGSVFILLLNVVCFHSEVLSGLLSTRRYIQYSGQRETQWTLHRVLSNTVHRIYAQNEKEEGH